MAWMEKAILDLSTAQYEPKVSEIVRDFVRENTWNTPFVIKTGNANFFYSESILNNALLGTYNIEVDVDFNSVNTVLTLAPLTLTNVAPTIDAFTQPTPSAAIGTIITLAGKNGSADATVNTMSQNSPGFEFANNLMQDQMNKPRGPPPPAPVETKNQPPPTRPGMTFTEAPGNRPDINASRGTMFRDGGVELNKGMANVNEQPRPMSRPEMRGPQNSDIDDILSGLKTRTVDIRKEPPAASMGGNSENNSMISVSSLKDLQNTNIPHKSSRKRNKSDKNIISLDI